MERGFVSRFLAFRSSHKFRLKVFRWIGALESGLQTRAPHFRLKVFRWIGALESGLQTRAPHLPLTPLSRSIVRRSFGEADSVVDHSRVWYGVLRGRSKILLPGGDSC